MKLNLIANGKSQERILAFLQENISETLADKINNGVYIDKDGKRLLNKKDLTTFMTYAEEQVLALIAENERKGRQVRCIDDKTVYGWAIHYFEEDGIEGKLYNEDGTEYKPTPKIVPKANVTKIQQKPKETVYQGSLFDNITGAITETQQKAELPEPATENKPAPEISPMYKHYLNIQKQYPDSIIAYRLGDFYEVFGENAKLLANELDLTLTGRDCGLESRVPMVGFPYHAMDVYMAKIVKKGYKIAIAEDVDNVRQYAVDTETGELLHSENPEEPEELPTVSKITQGIEIQDADDDMISEDDINTYFDKEALIDLFNVLGDKADLI